MKWSFVGAGFKRKKLPLGRLPLCAALAGVLFPAAAAAQDASELVYRADALSHARALEDAYMRLERHITTQAAAATPASWPNDTPPAATGWVADWTQRGIRARYCGGTLLVYVAAEGPMRGGTAQRSVQTAPRLYAPADTRGPALHWLRRAGTVGVEAHGGAGRTSVTLPACMTAALPTDRVALASTAGGLPDPWVDTWVSRRADIEWRACPAGHHVPGGQVASGQRWRVVREQTMSRHGRPIGAETVASQAMERDHCTADYTTHTCVPNASPPPIARSRYLRVEAGPDGRTRQRQFTPSPLPQPDPCAGVTAEPTVSVTETELHRASSCAAVAGPAYTGTARDRRLRRVTTFSWQTTPVTAYTPWVPDRSDCARTEESGWNSAACPSGYDGHAIRSRSRTLRRTRASWSAAPVVHPAPWSGWRWVFLRCERQVREWGRIACPPGQTGSIERTRYRMQYITKSFGTPFSATLPAPTHGAWGAWTETSRNCVTPPPPPPPPSDESGNSPSGDPGDGGGPPDEGTVTGDDTGVSSTDGTGSNQGIGDPETDAGGTGGESEGGSPADTGDEF